ncbi:uncharacterized protein DS421_13g395400 [Arachis hypogaea]|nr:uncharacterized protein DS421_13g395400 [Arachis hypogaea]
MESKEVAQNLSSPLMGLLSHSLSVSSMAFACDFAQAKPKNWRSCGSFSNEKGSESASCFGHSFGEVEGSLLGK